MRLIYVIDEINQGEEIEEGNLSFQIRDRFESLCLVLQIVFCIIQGCVYLDCVVNVVYWSCSMQLFLDWRK